MSRTVRRIQRAPSGHRKGEGHHNARLSDDDVELALQLHDAGLGYGTITKKLDTYDPPISRSTVRDICQRRHRI